MTIKIEDDALAVLKRSMELGNVDPELGGIRLRGARSLSGGFNVQVEFAETAPAGDEVLQVEGLNVFIDPALLSAIPDPVIALTPEHETIVVTSASDTV